MKQVGVSCLFATLLGCVSSATVGYIDDPAVAPGYVGRGHTAWLAGNRVFIEVEQIPGLNVADIEFEIRDDSIYLSPTRISSGGSGRRTFQIVIPTERLSETWSDRVFWLTDEGYYPITARGYWHSSERARSRRVRVEFTSPPSQEP